MVDRLPRPQRTRTDERGSLPLSDPGVRALYLRHGLVGSGRDADVLVPALRPLSRPSSSAPTSPPTASASSRWVARPARRDSISFQNAITAVTAPPAAELADRDSRRLLFYARSEPHAKRNMFELGLIAISQGDRGGGVRRRMGVLRDRLRLGAEPSRAARRRPARDPLAAQPVRLRRDARLPRRRPLADVHPAPEPRPDRDGLRRPAHGHQHLRYEDRRLRSARSRQPDRRRPSIEGVTAGLAEAVGRVGDHSGRVAGAAVDWSSDWEDSFSAPVMAEVNRMLGRCQAG